MIEILGGLTWAFFLGGLLALLMGGVTVRRIGSPMFALVGSVLLMAAAASFCVLVGILALQRVVGGS